MRNKNMQYNPSLNRRNFRVSKEIGVEEHNGDFKFKFKSGSGNKAVSCMRNTYGYITYRNRSVIVDVAMGKIPRFSERLVLRIQPKRLFCNFRGTTLWPVGNKLPT